MGCYLRRSGILLMAGLMALVIVAVAAESLDDFDYMTSVQVTNSTGSAFNNSPVAITMHPSQMVSDGYLQANGSDIRPANSAGTAMTAVAQDMGQTSATWWLTVPSQANGSTATYYLHTGNSTVTREQPIYLNGASENVTVADNATLDVALNLTMESLTTTLLSLPASTSYLIEKAEAYGLGVTGTALMAYVVNTTPATETLRPNGTGVYANLTIDVGCAVNWDCVEESVPDDDTSRLRANSTSLLKDSYALADTAIDANAVISDVTVYGRLRDGSSGSGAYRLGVRLGSSETLSATSTQINSWITQSASVARPGGGTWAVSDLNGLQAIVGLQDDGVQQFYLSTVWIIVTYRAKVVATYTGLAAGTTYASLKAAHDASNLLLFVNGTLQDTQAAAFTGYTNSSALVVGGGVTATIGGSRVGDTSTSSPVWVVDWEYEPDQMAQTQAGTVANSWAWTGTVQDQTANNNDGTYTYVRSSMANITAWVTGLEIKELPEDVVFTETIYDTLGDTGIDPASSKPEAPFLLRSFFDDAATAGTAFWTAGAWWFMVWTTLGLAGAAAVCAGARRARR